MAKDRKKLTLKQREQARQALMKRVHAKSQLSPRKRAELQEPIGKTVERLFGK